MSERLKIEIEQKKMESERERLEDEERKLETASVPKEPERLTPPDDPNIVGRDGNYLAFANPSSAVKGV